MRERLVTVIEHALAILEMQSPDLSNRQSAHILATIALRFAFQSRDFDEYTENLIKELRIAMRITGR